VDIVKYRRRKTMSQRTKHSAEFKAKVAREAIEGRLTLSEIAGTYGVHPNMISRWKQEALEGMVETFSSKRDKKTKDDEAEKEELYKEIGHLKVQVDWLKKKSGLIL